MVDAVVKYDISDFAGIAILTTQLSLLIIVAPWWTVGTVVGLAILFGVDHLQSKRRERERRTWRERERLWLTVQAIEAEKNRHEI